MITATVGYFIKGRGRHRKVLLGIKSKKICRNKRNGPGGKRERGESYIQCLIREIKEEVDVTVKKKHTKRVAVIDFINKSQNGDPPYVHRVAFYMITKWKGTFRSNGELRDLRWFPVNKPPLKELMLGHPFWFHMALSGNFVRGTVHYSPGRKYVDHFTLTARRQT